MIALEIRTLLPQLLTDDVHLPQPLDTLVLSFCHMICLLYPENDSLPNAAWGRWGPFHTVVMHVIVEHVERDCPRILYLHSVSTIGRYQGYRRALVMKVARRR